MKQFIATILAIAALVVFIDIVEPNGYGIFSKVDNGSIAVVTRFGKAQDEVLEPGFHVKGFFEVLHPMSIQKQTLSADFTAFSNDIQEVSTRVVVNYNVDKKTAATLYRDVGTNYKDTLITPRIYENTKIVFARYTAEGLITSREELSRDICELMKTDLAAYGINVFDILVEDIDFTDAFTDAVEAKQVASQNKLTAQTEQERLTMEASAEAERATIAANAAAEQRMINADAEAYAVKVAAEAEAEANQQIADSITEELIDYNKIQRWNGALPTVTGGATPIISLDGE